MMDRTRGGAIVLAPLRYSAAEASVNMAGRYTMLNLLTAKEDQILRAVLAGHVTAADLADHLGIKWRTVRTHLNTIRHKTETRNLADLVLWAWREGYQQPYRRPARAPVIDYEGGNDAWI